MVGGVLGIPGRDSCVSAAEAADGLGEALARTSEREGMRIPNTGSAGLSVPSGARHPTGMRPTAGPEVDGAIGGALEAVTNRVLAGWLPAYGRLRSDIE